MSDSETANATPSVSVVVPSYNHAQYVASCLRSIIGQSLAPAELLVIDDGSTDDSPKVIGSVLSNCPFPCELITRQNRGLCATLNQGLERTNGDYFAYLGSDDAWLQGFLAARTALLSSRPTSVLAYGHCYLIDHQDQIIDCTADWANYSNGDAREMLLRTTAPMSPTVMYVRESLARHGWNPTSSLEDYELYLKLSLDGSFAFDPRVLSAWRAHEDNASWNQEMMLDEHVSALEGMAPQLEISEEELQKLRKQIGFSRAEDFLRIGDKRRAVELVLANLSALGSPRLLHIGARLLLPFRAAVWQRKRKHAKAKQRYGKLDLF